MTPPTWRHDCGHKAVGLLPQLCPGCGRPTGAWMGATYEIVRMMSDPLPTQAATGRIGDEYADPPPHISVSPVRMAWHDPVPSLVEKADAYGAYPRCDSSYHIDTRRKPEVGERIVRCGLMAGHDGDHDEMIDGEPGNSWLRRPLAEKARTELDPADRFLALTDLGNGVYETTWKPAPDDGDEGSWLVERPVYDAMMAVVEAARAWAGMWRGIPAVRPLRPRRNPRTSSGPNRGTADVTEPECTCALVDITTNLELSCGEYRFVRGRADGCAIHESAEARAQREFREARETAQDATRRAAIEEAMRRAREAP